MSQLTVAAWSEAMGMSRQAGYAAVRRCGIPVSDGMLDADVATVLYRKRTRARANERRSGEAAVPPDATTAAGGQGGGDDRSGGDNYWANRGRREAAEAISAEIDLAKKLGEVVEAAKVQREQEKVAEIICSSMDNTEFRLAPLVAAESDPAKCALLIRSEIDEIKRLTRSQLIRRGK